MLKKEDFVFIGFKNDLESETKICRASEMPPLREGTEAYASVFKFREVDIVGKSSLRDMGPDVPVFAEFLPIDFDNKDLKVCYDETKALCVDLDKNEVDYFVFFSGNKGFHVLMDSYQFGFEPTNDNEVLKRMATAIAGKYSSFDPSIYNKTRIFRLPWSWNAKGAAYKVSISLEMSLETILDCAKKGIGPVHVPKEVKQNSALIKLYQDCLKPKINREVNNQQKDFASSLFIKAGEGNRNETAFTVARKLARKGISEHDAFGIMFGFWNEKMCSPPLDGHELRKVIKNAYDRGVNLDQEERKLDDISFDIKTCLNKSIEEFKNPHRQPFKTGYEFLDRFTMGFLPEELIFIVGRSGNFKSALLTNIIQRGSSLSNKPALLFSMEMGRHTLMPRLIQKAESLSKKQAITGLKEGVSYEKTINDFSQVKFIFQSGLNTEKMLNIIDMHLERYGALSAIGIDYLGLFRDVNNNTERTAKQAQELKTIIAKAVGCPVFCLAQAKQKYEGYYGDIELDRGCPKDSDTILDIGDYGIGIWGHWQTNDGKPEKSIFGRFFKVRGMDDELYGPTPYFGLDLNKQNMDIRDVVYVPDPPKFNQLGRQEAE